MKIILSLLCFEKDSHVAQVGLELAMYMMMILVACANLLKIILCVYIPYLDIYRCITHIFGS